MRATTAFNTTTKPLGATVTDVTFDNTTVVLTVRPRHARLRCRCGWSTTAVYDRSVRRWRDLDMFNTIVVFEGEIRRLHCRCCDRVVTEQVPWARPAARHTVRFDNAVAWWCQRADRTSVSRFFRCDWKTVTHVVARVVSERLTDTRFDGLTRIGVDELSWSKGHRYITVVVDQVSGHVIWVDEGRNADTLVRFYDLLGPPRCERLEAVSMDMGRAYAAATRACTNATICWDPFHVVKALNAAVSDTIRWSKLTKQGLPLTRREATDLRWALLKEQSDLTAAQRAVLGRHRKASHACWRAQQIKEDFRGIYQLDDPDHAAAYLDRWLKRAARSRIPPIIKAARTVREHQDGIIAAITLGLSNSRLEGTNSKIRAINHRGYGHHSVAALTMMIYLCCSGITIDPRSPTTPGG